MLTKCVLAGYTQRVLSFQGLGVILELLLKEGLTGMNKVHKSKMYYNCTTPTYKLLYY